MTDDMNNSSTPADGFVEGPAYQTPFSMREATNSENVLEVDVDGFEGPLDILLKLARVQKVDLKQISILQLAEQYLEFIDKVQSLKIEIAADYLVMASWLAYLKSRLLLPKENDDENVSAEEMAARLVFQLQRLESFQKISKILYSRSLINRDIFYGGSSDGLRVKYNIVYSSNLFDLLKSYSHILKSKDQIKHLTIEYSELFSVDYAVKRMKEMFGAISEWTNFLNILPNIIKSNRTINKSVVSSNFVASLELSKNGYLELKQDVTFGNIYIRSRNL